MKNRPNASQARGIVTLIFAVIILVPSMLGFGAKFLELVHTLRESPDGAFAVSPMLNYLLASMGFLCLLLWAVFNGMFHDLERPKHTMLETEHQLDESRPGN